MEMEPKSTRELPARTTGGTTSDLERPLRVKQTELDAGTCPKCGSVPKIAYRPAMEGCPWLSHGDDGFYPTYPDVYPEHMHRECARCGFYMTPIPVLGAPPLEVTR